MCSDFWLPLSLGYGSGQMAHGSWLLALEGRGDDLVGTFAFERKPCFCFASFAELLAKLLAPFHPCINDPGDNKMIRLGG